MHEHTYCIHAHTHTVTCMDALTCITHKYTAHKHTNKFRVTDGEFTEGEQEQGSMDREKEQENLAEEKGHTHTHSHTHTNYRTATPSSQSSIPTTVGYRDRFRPYSCGVRSSGYTILTARLMGWQEGL